MKSILRSLHCTFKYSLTPLAFLENLSPRGIILEAAICWPFSFTDKAHEIISLAISSGHLTDLRSLVPVCRTTRSGPTSYFMALVRTPGNGFTRIMLSLLVLFTIDIQCKCFTVESPTITVQGLLLCRVLRLICSVISSLSDFLSS